MSDQGQPLVRVDKVGMTYTRGSEPLHVLAGLTLTINEGDYFALMGPSGSGKSTLLNLIGGLDQPTEGAVVVGGEDLGALNNAELAEWRARNVGFIFQAYNLIPVLTAAQNVELPLLLQPLSRSERKEQVRRALALVGLSDRAGHYPNQLSGGQEQRVAIARAIVKKPELLLCDEPTGALDYLTGKLVLEVIERINHDIGTTVIVITHNAAIAGMADRVVRFGDGRIQRIDGNAHKLAPAELSW